MFNIQSIINLLKVLTLRGLSLETALTESGILLLYFRTNINDNDVKQHKHIFVEQVKCRQVSVAFKLV